MTAGAVGYEWRRFASYGAVAAVTWGAYSALVGFVGGVAFEGNVLMGLLLGLGWRQVRQTGSHRHFRHESRDEIVTVAGKPSDTLRPGTLANVRRTSGLKELR